MRLKLPTAVAALAITFSTGAALAGKAPPLDAGLYTKYLIGPTQVSFLTCGVLKNANTCYGCCGDFDLGPFEQACAVLEGAVTKKRNVLTRALYILDKRTASDHAPVTLYVYKRTDTITDDNDVLSIALTHTIKLGLKGGADSHCSMAANDAFLYVGTDADKNAVTVDKASFTVTPFGGTVPPTTVSRITADDRGYVSVVFGDSVSFHIFSPTGQELEGGGGGYELAGQRNAVRN